MVFGPFSIVITSFGEERTGLCASRAFVCLFCTRKFLSFFSSTWRQGLAAACDCGTTWTFLSTFLLSFVTAKVKMDYFILYLYVQSGVC